MLVIFLYAKVKTLHNKVSFIYLLTYLLHVAESFLRS